MDNRWIVGARLPTLGAAVAPVLVGTAVAAGHGVVAWRMAAALVVAVAIQVGTNYVNDAADGRRGTDDDRVGPPRLVSSGLATAEEVTRAAVAAFGVAGVAGLALTVAVGPELIPIGVASVAAGWFYTGGPRPYGYAGYGEAFVFVFFGLVATMGSAYVHTEAINGLSLLAGASVGASATSLLVVNNLRDIETDAAAGKQTLAVRWGPGRTRRLYLRLLSAAVVLGVLASVARPAALVAVVAVVAARRPAEAILDRTSGPALVATLVDTARFGLLHAVLLAAGFALSA